MDEYDDFMHRHPTAERLRAALSAYAPTSAYDMHGLFMAWRRRRTKDALTFLSELVAYFGTSAEMWSVFCCVGIGSRVQCVVPVADILHCPTACKYKPGLFLVRALDAACFTCLPPISMLSHSYTYYDCAISPALRSVLVRHGLSAEPGNSLEEYFARATDAGLFADEHAVRVWMGDAGVTRQLVDREHSIEILERVSIELLLDIEPDTHLLATLMRERPFIVQHFVSTGKLQGAEGRVDVCCLATASTPLSKDTCRLLEWFATPSSYAYLYARMAECSPYMLRPGSWSLSAK